MDHFAAALVARVKVKGAFNNAAENRIFDASNQELGLINDKAYIIDYKEIDKRQRLSRSRRKKGARLRLILEKARNYQWRFEEKKKTKWKTEEYINCADN